jgi:hypothetical protein
MPAMVEVRDTKARARGARRRLLLGAGTACAAGALSLPAAVLAGPRPYTLKVKVPRLVSSGAPYQVRVSGHARGSAKLLVFLDYHSCGRGPRAEIGHSAPGVNFAVSGSFRKAIPSHSELPSGRTEAADHVCAYLFGGAGAGRVLARAHRVFHVR